MSDYVETMAYAGRQTWHGKGVKLSGDQPSEIMLKEAGLDWLVERVPLWYSRGTNAELEVDEQTRDDGRLVKLPEMYAIRRTDTGRVVGYSHDKDRSFAVGRIFRPLQNHELFAFGDALRSTGSQVLWHTAGSLKGGRRVWAMARTEGQFEVKRRDGSFQQILPFLLLANAHDGSANVILQYTDVYVECWNTMSWAISKGTRSNDAAQYKLRHTTNLAERVEEAREALGLAHKHFEANLEFSQELANSPFPRESFVEFVAMMLTGKDDAEEAMEVVAKSEGRSRSNFDNKGILMSRLFQQGMGSQGGVDKLDALNSVTEMVDHYKVAISDAEKAIQGAKDALEKAEKARTSRSSDRALYSAWFGGGAKEKRRAAKLLATRW